MLANIGFKLFHSLILSSVLTFITLQVAAQGGLPEGEGRDIAIITCSQCHGLNYLGDVSLTAAQWENALYDMIARGAIVEHDDLEVLKDYLIDNYATDN